jgi:hypothetical protein
VKNIPGAPPYEARPEIQRRSLFFGDPSFQARFAKISFGCGFLVGGLFSGQVDPAE